VTRTEILLIIDSPLEFFPQRVVGDIYHGLHNKAWFKSVTSFEVGGRGYLTDAKEISEEMYQAPSSDADRATVEKMIEKNETLERQLKERTDAFFRVWNECERLRKEVNGGE
jgi:uncharacterized protein YgfB (UPF0149 family)